MSNHYHHPYEYYHRQRNDDEEQATGVRPSLRILDFQLPSWVSSDEDSSSLETGSAIITPQLIYEQRRILMEIEQSQQSQQQAEQAAPLKASHEDNAPSFPCATHDFILPSYNERSSCGSITSIEDSNMLNQSIQLFADVESDGGGTVEGSASYDDADDDDILPNFHHNMEPFQDEEEASYRHHRIPFNPAGLGQNDDLANDITRSTHSARPVSISTELPQPPQPPRYHQHLQPTQFSPKRIEAALVDESDDVETLRSRMEQDQKRSAMIRKSLQEETERLRNRISEMEQPKIGCCRGRGLRCILIWGLLLIAAVATAFVVWPDEGWMYFGKDRVSSSAASSENSTLAPSLLSPTITNSTFSPSMAPTSCQSHEISTYFGGQTYRTKSGQLDGRYDVNCKRGSGLLIVLQEVVASCEVKCVGYLTPVDYSRHCPNNRASTDNPTDVDPLGGGGGGSPPFPDVDFMVQGDFRNDILYLGYASSSFGLTCSQKLLML
ncbi:MAG: hypothetical protein SGBAC_011810 [Bacillariaceae sp.]